MFKVLRKADIFLFIFFILSAVIIAVIPVALPAGAGKEVRITARGQEYGVYPLDRDTEIEITGHGHTNIVEISEGKVWMEHSDCHNQICVNTKAISRTGETIVCLPNRVVVEIIGTGKGGDADDEIDAVVQ